MHARERVLKITRKPPRKKGNGRDRNDNRRPDADPHAWMRDWLEEEEKAMDSSRVRPSHAPLRPGPKMTLSEAILVEMNKHGMSMTELIEQTRLSRPRLNEIIDGAMPTPYEFRRLRHGLPRLSYLFTEEQLSPAAIVELEREERKKNPDVPRWAPPPVEVEEPILEPPPGTFGEALLRAIREEDMTIGQTAHLLEVTDQAVRYWIADSNVPVRPNYDKLLQLFPTLAQAPAPKTDPLEREKPVGNLFGREGETIMAAPRPTPVIERKNHVSPLPPNPPPVAALPPPVPAPTPAPAPAAPSVADRRDILHLGVQVAGILAEMKPEQVARLVKILLRAGNLGVGATELADVLRDYSPTEGSS